MRPPYSETEPSVRDSTTQSVKIKAPTFGWDYYFGSPQ